MRQHGDQLQVEVSVDDRAVDVRVAGEIDIATVAQFRSVLWAQPPRPLLRLDLSAVSVFSAVAIRTLVAAHLGIRARGGELVLVDPHPMIVRVLRSTGLHRVIPVAGSTPRVTLPPERPLVDVVPPPGVPVPRPQVPGTRITLPPERPMADVGSRAGLPWDRPRVLGGVPRVALPSTGPGPSTGTVPPRRFVAV